MGFFGTNFEGQFFLRGMEFVEFFYNLFQTYAWKKLNKFHTYQKKLAFKVCSKKTHLPVKIIFP
jgi:hypothetical protein